MCKVKGKQCRANGSLLCMSCQGPVCKTCAIPCDRCPMRILCDECLPPEKHTCVSIILEKQREVFEETQRRNQESTEEQLAKAELDRRRAMEEVWHQSRNERDRDMQDRDRRLREEMMTREQELIRKSRGDLEALKAEAIQQVVAAQASAQASQSQAAIIAEKADRALAQQAGAAQMTVQNLQGEAQNFKKQATDEVVKLQAQLQAAQGQIQIMQAAQVVQASATALAPARTEVQRAPEPVRRPAAANVPCQICINPALADCVICQMHLCRAHRNEQGLCPACAYAERLKAREDEQKRQMLGAAPGGEEPPEDKDKKEIPPGAIPPFPRLEKVPEEGEDDVLDWHSAVEELSLIHI